MPRERVRSQTSDRQRIQKQIQARQQAEVSRLGLDRLADPGTFDRVPPVGTLPGKAEYELDEYLEADVALTEAGEEEGSGSEPDPEESENLDLAELMTAAAPAGVTLKDLLGTSPPITLARVAMQEDEVEVDPLIPAFPGTEDALKEICDLIKCCFEQGRKELTEAEWGQLLGSEPAPFSVRLLLLSRLAIAGQESIPLDEHASFSPNNRGLERYAGKLALLPDGVPFSIRLLLEGSKRGRRSANEDLANHPFGRLPESIKLLALRRALQREREQGRAHSDEEFRGLLGEALKEMGIPVPRPYWKHVEMLRSSLKRKGLADVFPNAVQRQACYDLPRKENHG
jgi:hypothetical protein